MVILLSINSPLFIFFVFNLAYLPALFAFYPAICLLSNISTYTYACPSHIGLFAVSSLDSGYVVWSDDYVHDMSFLGHHIWRHIGDTNFDQLENQWVSLIDINIFFFLQQINSLWGFCLRSHGYSSPYQISI